MRLERRDEGVPRMSVSDLNFLVFIVLVKLGVVRCGEMFECWCHFVVVDEGVVGTFKEVQQSLLLI